MMYQIKLPYACFGVEVDDMGWIVEAPPIGNWMIGKRLHNVKMWLRTRGGSIKAIEDESDSFHFA